MSLRSASARQFTAHHSSLSMGGGYDGPTSHQTGESRPTYQGPSSLASHTKETASSFGRQTAWSIHRSGSSSPLAYSKQTGGSTYRFE